MGSTDLELLRPLSASAVYVHSLPYLDNDSLLTESADINHYIFCVVLNVKVQHE